jgi:hypothetical protein
MGLRRYKYRQSLDGRSIRLLRIESSPPPGIARAPTSGSDAEALFGLPTPPESSATPAILQMPTSGHGNDGNFGLPTPPYERQVRLELCKYDIGSAPSYKALSYTWQRPVGHRRAYTEAELLPVMINGEEHDVLPNLYDALAQLGESCAGDHFWIDALCINQQRLDERQTQVAIMDEIYRNADEVVVWLGKADGSSARVLELVRHVASWAGRANNHEVGYVEPVQLLREFGFGDPAEAIWTQYLHLYERNWFQRGWVIQEVGLAKKATMYWGSQTIDWRQIELGSKIFLSDRARKGYFARLLGGYAEVKDKESLPLGRNALRMGLIMDACFGAEATPLLIVELATGSKKLASAAHILLHLMRMSRDFCWSDQRDKVYSLLGLVHHTADVRGLPRLDLRPDYGPTSTPATVLTAAAAAIVRSSNCVGIIMQVSDPSFRTLDGLPSWVPDFVKSPNYAMGSDNPFDASRFHTLGQRAYDLRDGTLLVEGVLVGRLCGGLDLGDIDDCDKLFAVLRMASHATVQGAAPVDVLWRTLLWDVHGHNSLEDEYPAPDYLAKAFVCWIASVLEQQRSRLAPSVLAELSSHLQAVDVSVGKDAAEEPSTNARIRAVLGRLACLHYEDHLLDLSWGPDEGHQDHVGDPYHFPSLANGVIWSQQLFRMDPGYVGMGPKSSRAGDEVWIVSGCPFPMVMRRRGDAGGSHCVIGRAFIHGLMSGEAVTETSSWENICLK